MQTPPRNNEGFLEDPSQWSPEVAETIAAESGIELTDAHWEIIYMLRKFYADHDMAPPAARFSSRRSNRPSAKRKETAST